MDRKKFIQNSASLFAVSAFPSGAFDLSPNKEEGTFLTPPYLKEKDIVSISSPAGYIKQEEIQSAIKRMEGWGYRTKIGNTIGKRDFTFGGTDEERAEDFQQMLDDPEIKAIMCARGGYGAIRIIDKLNWEKFKLHPKWIIGFSDITIFHSHLSRNLKTASIHSKMCNSFPDDWAKAEPIQIETIESIHQALRGDKLKYSVLPNSQNKPGQAKAVLIGGNLKTLESLAGSASDIKTAGKILFVEDSGEFMYSIDRMFWNLKRSGKLSELKGLIVGGFRIKTEEGGDDFGKTLQDVVLEKVKEYSYPVCFDFPVGHIKNNFALKCGVLHKLSVSVDSVFLNEV